MIQKVENFLNMQQICHCENFLQSIWPFVYQTWNVERQFMEVLEILKIPYFYVGSF